MQRPFNRDSSPSAKHTPDDLFYATFTAVTVDDNEIVTFPAHRILERDGTITTLDNMTLEGFEILVVDALSKQMLDSVFTIYYVEVDLNGTRSFRRIRHRDHRAKTWLWKNALRKQWERSPTRVFKFWIVLGDDELGDDKLPVHAF